MIYAVTTMIRLPTQLYLDPKPLPNKDGYLEVVKF
jgi:hypothetical protein